MSNNVLKYFVSLASEKIVLSYNTSSVYSLSVGLVGLEPKKLDQLALVGAVLHHTELEALAKLFPELHVRVLLSCQAGVTQRQRYSRPQASYA